MKSVISIIAACGFSTIALAQELPSFEEVDQNNDGMISEAEASAVEGLDFAAADENHDGAISPTEYQQLS